MAVKVILTCEHAANAVPLEYKYVFQGKEDVLMTHRAIDFGAFEAVRSLQEKVHAPLFYSTICRLLIEVNRREDSAELFSEFTKDLPFHDRHQLIETYYNPYRHKVQNAIADEVLAGNFVLHLSMHSFTPVFKDEMRIADIGLLYDPSRDNEKAFSEILFSSLEGNNPKLIVKHNYPYKGIDDGLTTFLRTEFSDHHYAGFELELNQKFFLQPTQNNWTNFQQVVCDSIEHSIKAFKPVIAEKV